MIDLDEFRRFRKAIEDRKKESERAAGQLEQLMGRLADEHDCKTVAEAEALLADLASRLEEDEKEFAAGLEEFEKLYGEKLA